VLGATLVLALVVGVAFALLLRAIAAQRTSAALSLQSHNVLASANRLQRLVVDLETGARGYLLTGDESFLRPWSTARLAVGEETANLQQLTVVPEQDLLAAQITSSVFAYLDDYSNPLVEAARRGDPAARSVATTAEGKRRVDALRAQFDALEANETRIASARDASSTADADRAVTGAVAGLSLSVPLTLLLAGYLTRAIVRPVRRAAGMADQLARGDLSTRIPETGVGELRALERSFNQMGRSLERGRDQLARLLEEQLALRRVATLVAHGEPPEVVFAAVVQEAATVLGVDGARMLRREPDGTATVLAGWGATNLEIPVGAKVSTVGANIMSLVVRTGKPGWLDSFSGPEGSLGGVASARAVQLSVGAPIMVQGQVWGVMVALSIDSRPSPVAIEDRLAQFTDLVAAAIANTQARQELAASRARLVVAGDETRRRIERDLHDGIQQRLVSLALDLRGVQAALPDAPAAVQAQLSEAVRGLGATLEELREIARGIHPAILSEGGLVPALKALARRSAVPVQLITDIPGRLPPATEVTGYYVVAELLTNVAKHARASSVRVEAEHTGGRLDLVISDDGSGGADPARGTGLTGLVDRIEAVGGRIGIVSPPGAGTTVRVQLPADTG
jgi:signal transduction histidine kinase